jgi:hypothetical protein
MSNRIIDRIQKLLRLASNAGSEAEAALAAQRAADLMAEHEIHEAELALQAGDTPRVAEPIEKCFEVTKTKKRVAWHSKIVGAVADSYGAKWYWQGGRLVLFGRLSAVQAATYTSQYLMNERMTDREAPSPRYTKADRNGFRLGCAGRVAQRVYAQTTERKAQNRTPDPEPVPNIFDDTPATPAPGSEEEPAPQYNPMALAIVEKDRQEVEDAYDTYSERFGKAPSIGKVSSYSGYQAGREAGKRINLGGNARGGLKAGQGTLK